MSDQYVPGSCNIGPDEIALRRRVGHAGLAVTAALGAALLRSDLHPAWRLTLAVPAAGAASGYLQARQRFCANFGWRGVYNFDRLGQERPATGDHTQTEDRRRAWQITAASAAIGVGVALVATSL
jgi:predicted lipase